MFYCYSENYNASHITQQLPSERACSISRIIRPADKKLYHKKPDTTLHTQKKKQKKIKTKKKEHKKGDKKG
jgi:hypothetical protein